MVESKTTPQAPHIIEKLAIEYSTKDGEYFQREGFSTGPDGSHGIIYHKQLTPGSILVWLGEGNLPNKITISSSTREGTWVETWQRHLDANENEEIRCFRKFYPRD